MLVIENETSFWEILRLSCFYDVFIVRNEGCNHHCHLAGISRTMELKETCHSPTPSALQSSQPGCASSGKDVRGQQSDLSTSALPAAILIFSQQNCVLYCYHVMNLLLSHITTAKTYYVNDCVHVLVICCIDIILRPKSSLKRIIYYSVLHLPPPSPQPKFLIHSTDMDGISNSRYTI